MKEVEIHDLTERLGIYPGARNVPSEKVELLVTVRGCQPLLGKVAH